MRSNPIQSMDGSNPCQTLRRAQCDYIVTMQRIQPGNPSNLSRSVLTECIATTVSHGVAGRTKTRVKVTARSPSIKLHVIQPFSCRVSTSGTTQVLFVTRFLRLPICPVRYPDKCPSPHTYLRAYSPRKKSEPRKSSPKTEIPGQIRWRWTRI